MAVLPFNLLIFLSLRPPASAQLRGLMSGTLREPAARHMDVVLKKSRQRRLVLLPF
jgi:hypothetical protein